ncbi:MAG: hypothetical protein AAB540_02385, partial [Patescibacteria group bacterium]
MKKHGNCKKYHGHKKIVGGIVAAALAFTMVVGSQLGSYDSGQLSANITCPDGTSVPDGTTCPYTQPTNTYCPDGSMVPMGTTCPSTNTGSYTCPDGSSVPNGTPCPQSGSTGGTIWCFALNRQATPEECGASGTTWTGTSYSGTTGDAGSAYVTQPTCQSAAYFWSYSTNKCYTTQAEKTAAETAMGYNYGTTSGQSYSDTTSTYSYPAGTCSNGTSYPAGTGTPPCGNMTTGTYSGSTSGQYQTQATCETAALFWGVKSNWCFNTQA